MHDTKGFTLTELIIVIAILAILAAVFIPQLIALVDESQEAVCRSNRAQILRQYAYISALHSDSDTPVTLSDILDNKYDLYVSEDSAIHGCPAGGTYTVDEATHEIICSKHKDAVSYFADISNKEPLSKDLLALFQAELPAWYADSNLRSKLAVVSYGAETFFYYTGGNITDKTINKTTGEQVTLFDLITEKYIFGEDVRSALKNSGTKVFLASDRTTVLAVCYKDGAQWKFVYPGSAETLAFSNSACSSTATQAYVAAHKQLPD